MGVFKNVVKLCFFVWNIFNKTIVSIFAYLFNKIIRIINADHWALKRVTSYSCAIGSQEITELINIARMEVFLIGLAVDKLTTLVSCQRVNHKGPFFTIESNVLFM